MILDESFTLSDGTVIPKLGLGTWQMLNDEAEYAVSCALRQGYRHIDTAASYENEVGVGKGIKKSGVKRLDVFVTTKVPAWIKTGEEAEASIRRSLERLSVDYVDLLLIHAPKPWQEIMSGSEKTYYKENVAVWQAMEKAQSEGLVRALGVSNFTPADLENIKSSCTAPVTVNQIKLFIGFELSTTMRYCEENGILVEGYSPIATGELLKNVELKRIAEGYGVSVPRLCIRYVLQRNALPLPKARHEEFIKENAMLDFEISSEDMKYLRSLSGTVERYYGLTEGD